MRSSRRHVSFTYIFQGRAIYEMEVNSFPYYVLFFYFLIHVGYLPRYVHKAWYTLANIGDKHRLGI